MKLNEEVIYANLGEEGFTRLVRAFYQRMRTDDLIGPMYPDDDWLGAEERLRDFLLFRFGADQRYLVKRGHPRLRGRHMPFHIGKAESERWVEIMQAAADEVVVDDSVRGSLMAFFSDVAAFLQNSPS